MAKNAVQKRRAEQRAAEHELAQKAVDSRNQTIVGIIVVAVIIVALCVSGFFVWQANKPVSSHDLADARAAVEKVANKPAAAGSEYGFLISKDGINKPIKGVPTVQVYMDFLCPACGTIERSIGPTWTTMLNAGQVNLDLHPSAFLDAASSDQYSTRTASAATYIAQNDPTHLEAFITALFDEKFQPEEGPNYKPVDDSAIVAQAKKAGVPDDIAQNSVNGTYTEWVKAVANYTMKRPEVQHPDGTYKGQMTTPTILINGNYWNIPSGSSLSNSFAAAIGLDQNQIGTSTLPSIGDSGAPISASK